jgi:hypothetical protein
VAADHYANAERLADQAAQAIRPIMRPYRAVVVFLAPKCHSPDPPKVHDSQADQTPGEQASGHQRLSTPVSEADFQRGKERILSRPAAAALDAGAGPEIVTWPLLLAGLGVGALASQLGSVTVSSVPDEQSGEVGGIQNTVTNLGASLGTALAGAVLISALTASFLAGVQQNPAVPKDLAAKAQVELSGGIPFMSDKDLQAQLDKAGVPPKTADAIVTENANARIAGLRSSLSLLAAVALIALFFTRRIPARQPSAASVSEPAA